MSLCITICVNVYFARIFLAVVPTPILNCIYLHLYNFMFTCRVLFIICLQYLHNNSLRDIFLFGNNLILFVIANKKHASKRISKKVFSGLFTRQSKHTNDENFITTNIILHNIFSLFQINIFQDYNNFYTIQYVPIIIYQNILIIYIYRPHQHIYTYIYI